MFRGRKDNRRHILRGFITFAGAYRGLIRGTKEECRLKVATLFYDTVVLPVDSGHLKGIIDIYGGEGATVADFEKAWTSIDGICSHMDMDETLFRLRHPERILLWGKDGQIRKGLRGAVDEAVAESFDMSTYGLKKYKSEFWTDYVRETNAMAGSALGGATVWRELSKYVPCAFVGFYRAEVVAAKIVLHSDFIHDGSSTERTISAYVPSVRELPWEAIFDLRKDKRIGSFRNWLMSGRNQHCAQQETDASSRALDALWAAVGDLRVSVGGEFLKGIASNIPLPIPVNPASVFLSGKAIRDAIAFEKKYGWLMFFHTMREKQL